MENKSQPGGELVKTPCKKNSKKHRKDVNQNDKAKPNNNIPPENSEMKLKRGIGLFEAVGITIGSIIGSGIFISPKGVLVHVKSVGASLSVWATCGLLSMVGAFCFAELGTTFPSAGGQYTYIFEAFGPVIAFLSLWAHNLMFVPIGNAVTGLVFAKYMIQPLFPTGCEVPDMAVRLLAASAILLLSLLNCCDIRYINKFIDIFMFLKLTAVVLIIIGGGFAVLEHGTHNFDDMWTDSNITLESLLFATYAGFFAFGGWQAMSTMMEELIEPNKNLPRAIFISLTIITLVYLLANASYFVVLTPAEMVLSDAVAVTFVNKLLGMMGWIVPIFVCISTFGFLSLHILTNSRNCFVGARNGHFPSVLALITTTYQTPAPSIIFQAILSIMFLYTADVFALINFGALISWMFSAVSIAALLYLRWTKPELERPFKVHISVPCIYFIITLIFTLIPVYVSPIDAVISVGITLSGLPVYYFLVTGEQSKLILKISECFTVAVQKLLMSVQEDF